LYRVKASQPLEGVFIDEVTVKVIPDFWPEKLSTKPSTIPVTNGTASHEAQEAARLRRFQRNLTGRGNAENELFPD